MGTHKQIALLFPRGVLPLFCFSFFAERRLVRVPRLTPLPSPEWPRYQPVTNQPVTQHATTERAYVDPGTYARVERYHLQQTEQGTRGRGTNDEEKERRYVGKSKLEVVRSVLYVLSNPTL